MSKKLLTAAVLGTTTLWSLGIAALPVVNAQTTANIQAQIQALLAQIAALQAQLGGTGSGSTTAYTFTKTLTIGSTGADVTQLQQYLINNGYLAIAAPTGYFGAMTKAAVAKWQAAEGISPAAGYFGAISRARLNAILAAGTPSTPGTPGTPVGTGFNVSLASDTPAAGSIVAGQSIADLGHFNFSNAGMVPVTVTSVKIHRIGVSSDTTLTNVYLYQGNNKLTDAGSLSAGVITFSNPAGLFTIPAGSSMNIAVRSDIYSSASGAQTIGVQVASAADVVSNASAVNGNFPVNSNLMTVASVSDLATAQFTAAVTTVSTPQAGTSNMTVWQDYLNVGTRALKFSYLRMQNIGSVPSDALQNIALYVDGNKVSTGVVSGSYIVFDMTGAPVTLNTGSRIIEVHADIVKGSNRSFALSLPTKSDITLVDTQYGVNIAVSSAGSYYPPLTANSVTISYGTVTTQQDPSFSVTQVTKNASNVTLGQWTMKAYGEDVRVGSLQLYPSINNSTTDANGDGYNNLAIYVNGGMVGSSQNWIKASGAFPSLSTFGSGNLFTIPAGTTVTVAVKGDIVLAANTTSTSEYVNLYIPASTCQGLSSLVTTACNGGAIQSIPGQTLTFTTGSVTVAANGAYTAQATAPNVTNYKVGSYILQAGAAEPIRVTNLAIGLTPATMAITNLANLYVTDNATPVSPQTSNNFSVNYTLQPGQTKTIDVFADIGANTGSVTSSLLVTATGVNTGTSVGGSTATQGQTITVAAGTFGTPTFDGSSPVSALVDGGTTAPKAVYKFTAANGAATIKELRFTVTDASEATSTNVGNSIGSITAGGVTAPIVFDSTNGVYVAYLTGLAINVPAGNLGTTVPVSATYNAVGTNAATTNQQLQVNLAYAKYQIGSTIADIGTTAYSTTNTGFTGTYGIADTQPSTLVASKPTVTKNSASGQLASGYVPDANSEILRFDVTADSTGPVLLKKFTVTPVFSATASTTAINVYDAANPSQSLGNTTFSATSGTKRPLTFTNEQSVPAGTTKTYIIRGDTSSGWSWTAGQSIRMDLTSADSWAAATSTSGSWGDWAWSDGTLSSGTYVNGNLVKNLTVTGGTFVK